MTAPIDDKAYAAFFGSTETSAPPPAPVATAPATPTTPAAAAPAPSAPTGAHQREDGGRLDQRTIDAAKAVDIADLVRSRGVELTGSGNEFKGLCPFHDEKSPSFTVNTAKAFYHCFGCGAHGDAIDLVREHDGLTFHEAVHVLVGGVRPLGSAPHKTQMTRAEPIEEWSPITPVPEDADQAVPTVFHRRNGDGWQKLESKRRWAYRDADGRLLGYVHRFEWKKPDGTIVKDCIPQSYCVNSTTDEMRWKWQSFAKPRPLYGLDKLAKYPDAAVIMVEGEKAADRGQERFIDAGLPMEKLIVLAWPGGGKGVKHVDWTPLHGRKVGLWPDADLKRHLEGHPRAGKLLPFIGQPGTVAMLDVFERIKGRCSVVRFILPRSSGLIDGWDVADVLPADFNLRKHVKTHGMNAADVQKRFSLTPSITAADRVLPVWLVPPTTPADLRRASFAADVMAMTDNELAQRLDPRGVVLHTYDGSIDGLRDALAEFGRLMPSARVHAIIPAGLAADAAKMTGFTTELLQPGASWVDDLWAEVTTRTGLEELEVEDPGEVDPAEREQAPESVAAPVVGELQVEAADATPGRQPVAVVDDETSDACAAGHFAVLGFGGDKYYIFHHKKRLVLERSRHDFTDVGLVELAPRHWWESNNFGGSRGGIDKAAAAEWIFGIAHARGFFDVENRMRGRGAWRDKGRSVFHHGDHLTVDGVTMDLTQIEKTRFIYENKTPLPAVGTPATSQEGEKLLATAQMMRWVNPASAMFLCGWVFLAPVGGALKWRPHIWITGEAGGGKSAILNDFAGRVLGATKLSLDAGDSSAAGIRQKLKRDALPVVLDEAEGQDEKGRERMRGILTLARGASTDGDTMIAKGTVSGRALEFSVRSMFCLGAIGALAQNKESDNSRFATLAVRNKSDTSVPDRWAQLKPALDEIERDEDLPARLLSRAILMLPTLYKCISLFAAAAAKRLGSERYGDQYGTLLAGYWCLTHDQVVTEAEAQRIIDGIRWDDFSAGTRQATPDAAKCLDAILDHIITEKGSTVSIRSLVAIAAGRLLEGYDISASTAKRLLQDRGLTITNNKERGRLLGIIRNSTAVAQILRSTEFAMDWQTQLPRVDDYVPLHATSYGPSGQDRGHGFPLSSIRLPDDSSEPPI